MLNVEIQIKEKESMRANKGKLKESGMLLSPNNLGDSNNNVFDNLSNSEIDELKRKNEELENENMNLRKELELIEMNEKSELEKVQKDNYLLQSELENEKLKNLKASQEIIKLKENLETIPIEKEKLGKINEKVKKYNVVLSYIKQVINVWNPTENKDIFLLNKLKSIAQNDEKIQ